MAPPEIKVGLGLSLGKTGDFQPSTAGNTPTAYKGTPFESDFNTKYPQSAPSPSYAKFSLEGEFRGILDYANICHTAVCKRVDAGIQVGIGDWSLSALAQYRHPFASFSVLARTTIGAEWYSGDAKSRLEMGDVHISGAALAVTAGIGPEFMLANNVPLQVQLGVHYNPSTDMGHGFELAGGRQYMLSVSGGWNVFGSTHSTSAATPAASDEDCQDAAAGLQLGPNTLSAAVAKCKDSALPVFEAMAKRITEFKVVVGDPANLKEYGLYLKQFAEGIASAVAASKLTDADAVGMMKQLAKFHRPLLAELFIDPTRHEQALEAGLMALHYPILPLLKIDPADAAIKKSADEVLNLILESAQHEGKAFLPNVLNQLITIGKDSAWLKSHKHDLLDAAKKLPRGADRTAIEKSLQTTFK